MSAARNAAVLLDKDGTLVENVPMNVDPARIRLMPGAAAALRRLRDAGFRLAVVSNQGGVAHGRFAASALRGVEERITALLREHGVGIDLFLWCPHDPSGTVSEFAVPCDCRKPAPGLVRRALERLDADPARSWMVGDILHDVEAGARAGCRTILLDSGGETEWVPGPFRTPDLVASDFAAVADAVLSAREVAA